MAKVCLDLHDFSVVNNRLDLLLKLKEHFPGFKVSLFTIPIDVKSDWGPYLLRREFLEKIKENLDWMQFVPHGLIHGRKQYADISHWGFKLELDAIEKIFVDDGLPLEKGFCAPHYDWTKTVVRTLDTKGWWGAIPRDKVVPTPKRFYKFSHAINEPLDKTSDCLKLHGHIYGTKSDLGLCMENLLKLPIDTDWHFCTDFLETNESV